MNQTRDERGQRAQPPNFPPLPELTDSMAPPDPSLQPMADAPSADSLPNTDPKSAAEFLELIDGTVQQAETGETTKEQQAAGTQTELLRNIPALATLPAAEYEMLLVELRQRGLQATWLNKNLSALVATEREKIESQRPQAPAQRQPSANTEGMSDIAKMLSRSDCDDNFNALCVSAVVGKNYILHSDTHGWYVRTNDGTHHTRIKAEKSVDRLIVNVLNQRKKAMYAVGNLDVKGVKPDASRVRNVKFLLESGEKG